MLTLTRTDIVGRTARFQIILCADQKDHLLSLRPLRRGETLVKVSEVTGVSAWFENVRNRVDGNKVNQVLGDCADLLAGGMQIVDALALQMRRTENPIIRYHLARVIPLLKAGKPLHEAFAREKAICDDRLSSILFVAENSGKLVEVLRQLKAESEYSSFVAGTVTMLLVYPYIVQFAFVALLAVFSTKIVPPVGDFYHQFHAPLPWFSRVHYVVLKPYGEHWIICSLIEVALLIALLVFRDRVANYPAVRQRLYWIPVIGPFLERNEVVVAVSHMGVALNAGLTVVQALNMTRDIFKKPAMAAAWSRTAHEAANGTPVARVIEAYAIEFGDIGEELAAMIQIGEEGRTMAKQMTEFSQRLRDRMTIQTKNLEKKAGPMITIMLMLEVVVIMVPVQVPLMRMGELVRPGRQVDAVQQVTAATGVKP